MAKVRAVLLLALLFLACTVIVWQQPAAFATEQSIGRGPDSDSDGLSDSFEVRLGSDPAKADSDGDGLTDGLEYTGGGSGMPSDPTDRDSDNDGLSDGLEHATGTDPHNRDSDGDGLSDSLEINKNTNPLLGDTDRDGTADNIEIWHGTDPLNPESFFVLPESPIGPVMMVLASAGALVAYMRFKRK